MSENNEFYDHLSAARIVYQENYDNELDIIKELKIYLLESGYSIDSLNNRLYNFYQYINIPIELNTINNVSINSDPNINNMVQIIFNPNFINNINNHLQFLNNNDNNDNNNDNENDNDNNENVNPNEPPDILINNTNIINILNTLITNLNNNNNIININNNIIQNLINIEQPVFSNVAVTIDDEDFKNLETEVLKSDHESNCSICMSQMLKDEKITLLNCNHNFHYECITPYLKEYNYKCPICRSEVGKAKYNI